MLSFKDTGFRLHGNYRSTISSDKRKDNALFIEIAASQKAFAERAVRWELDTVVSRRMAYNHYFGKPAAEKKKA